MNTKDLENEISKRTGYTKSAVSKVIDSFKDVILEAVGRGDSVTMQNFGKFTLKRTKRHKARDFKTGNIIDVDGKSKLSFACSKALIS